MAKKETNKGIGFESSNKKKSSTKRNNHLLLVGINTYKDAGIPNLNNAVSDVKAFKNILLDKYRFPNDYITELYDKKATRKNILKAFKAYAKNLTPNDNLIIYYSGHGEYEELFQEGYWLPSNGTLGEHDEYVSNADIRKRLSVIKSHHIFLISDSCFSGSFFAEGSLKSTAQKSEIHASRWGLTSGRKEVVADGIKGEQSPFSKALLNTLSNSSKVIGVRDLCLRVEQVVKANSEQSPTWHPLRVGGHDFGEFCFHPKENEIEDWEKASQSNNISSLEAFVQKYHNSKYLPKAQSILYELKASHLWNEIQGIKEENPLQIKRKIARLTDYLDKYTKASEHEAALDVEEFLEYKLEFIELKNKGTQSALRKFIKIRPPEMNACLEMQEEAKEVLQKIKSDRKAELAAEERNRQAEIEQAALLEKEKQATEAKRLALENKRKQAAEAKRIELENKRKEEEANNNKLIIPENMVLVKGGTFRFGKDKKKALVTLDDFYISKYQVTNQEYATFLNEKGNQKESNVTWLDMNSSYCKIKKNQNKFTTEKGFENHPVVKVSWFGAKAYCEWKDGRLATESEWEFAARGGNKTKDYTYSGSNNIDEVAWYKENSKSQLHEVGLKKENELGLYDMSGNVWEWCNDWFGSDYFNTKELKNPLGPKYRSSRVLRGGSWGNLNVCRSTNRNDFNPTNRGNSLGFRLALVFAAV